MAKNILRSKHLHIFKKKNRVQLKKIEIKQKNKFKKSKWKEIIYYMLENKKIRGN